jgi:TPR repeat protein
MKMAPVLGSSALIVSLLGGPSLNAQNTPTKLTQPAVNAQAQNQADINAEAQRDPRFTSRYGSARPATAAPAAAVAPGAVAPQAPPPADDPRFTSRYGSARPQAARAAAPTPAGARPPVAAPAPGTVATPAPVAAPAPVRRVDPERDQRILNFQRQNAASGNPSAQYDLGMRYLRGNGVEQDDAQAMEWLKLASQNGDGRAKKELAELQTKASATDAPAKVEPAPTKAADVK